MKKITFNNVKYEIRNKRGCLINIIQLHKIIFTFQSLPGNITNFGIKIKAMATTIIFNACIITMNDDMEVIKNGSIRVEDNQIKEIREGKIEFSNAEYFDAEGMIVMPGFINTHTHVPMTMLRGYADDLPLHTWLNEHIFPAEARMVNPENVALPPALLLSR